VVFRANQIVAGLALVIFGTGLANFLGKPAEGKTVSTVIKPISFGPLSDIPIIGQSCLVKTSSPILQLH